MRTLFFLFLASTCEPAKSLKPFPSPIKDSRLVGTWQAKNALLHVVPHGDNELDLVLIGSDDKGAHVLHYQGQATADRKLSLRAKTYPDPLKDDFSLSSAWTLAQYDLDKAGILTLSFLEEPPDGKPIADPVGYQGKWRKLDFAFKKR